MVGLRKIAVSTDLLSLFIRGKVQPAYSDVPDDLLVIGAMLDESRPEFVVLLCASKDFEKGTEGAAIPEFQPQYVSRLDPDPDEVLP